MRNNLILSAMAFAALTLVGCAQDDVVHESSSANNAIKFGTYVGRAAQTRASVVNLETIKENGFGVFAFYTGLDNFADYTGTTPNFMNNQKVTWKADATDATKGEWVYTPVKYWPNNEGDKLSFFAYAPYDKDQTWPIGTQGSNTEIYFEVKNNVQEQTDLLWNNNLQVDLKKPHVDSVIKFNFGHALARIGFKLAGAFDSVDAGTGIDDNTVITVKKVMLAGDEHVYNGPGNVTEPQTGIFHENGYLELTTPGATPTWSNVSGSQTLTWSSEVVDDFKEGANILQVKGADDTYGDEERVLNGDDAYAMVIPQELTATDKLYVYIEYEVKTTDTNVEGNSSTITNYISREVTIPDSKLQAGKAYTLKLVLGMTTVQITADIVDWVPVDDIKVDLPENTAPTPAPTPGA